MTTNKGVEVDPTPRMMTGSKPILCLPATLYTAAYPAYNTWTV
jgi:hypothetical protein